MNGHVSTLAEKLINTGYIDLFMRTNENAIDEIWADKNYQEELHTIITDDAVPVLARFLAAEILFKKDASFPTTQEQKKMLAKIYVEILSDQGTVNGNIWGLPGYAGIIGEHMLKADKDELTILLKDQLNNQQPVLYDGSREATFGNEYQYRVKDIAAFYFSLVLKQPYTVLKQPEERDAAIQQLQQFSANK
jgi:hypothetical protein